MDTPLLKIRDKLGLSLPDIAIKSTGKERLPHLANNQSPRPKTVGLLPALNIPRAEPKLAASRVLKTPNLDADLKSLAKFAATLQSGKFHRDSFDIIYGPSLPGVARRALAEFDRVVAGPVKTASAAIHAHEIYIDRKVKEANGKGGNALFISRLRGEF